MTTRLTATELVGFLAGSIGVGAAERLVELARSLLITVSTGLTPQDVLCDGYLNEPVENEESQ